MKNKRTVFLLLSLALLVFSGMSFGGSQLRTLLASKNGISDPVDGDLAADFGPNQVYIYSQGGWRSLRAATGAIDVAARLPDYRTDGLGILTVAPGTVLMRDGESFQNSGALTFRASLVGPPTQQYVLWRALFAFPDPSGTGFVVATSANFVTPDTLPTGVVASVIANSQYRYLGTVGLRPADGQFIQMKKVENRFFYRVPALVAKDLTGSVQKSTIPNASPRAQAITVGLEFYGPGTLLGPGGELYGKFAVAQENPSHLQFEIPVQAGSFSLTGTLPDCDHDQADQALLGHVEDPALFTN